jgi:hypothetical protein
MYEKKMYTKQHFENIAQFVQNSAINQKETMAFEFVKVFSLDNSKFKPEKFLKTCGFIQLQADILKNPIVKADKSLYSILSYVILN